MISRVRGSRSGWVWAAGAALGFIVVQVLIAPSVHLAPDSARYAESTYRYLGNDPEVAHALAVRLWCADQAAAVLAGTSAKVTPNAAVDPVAVVRDCVTANADHFIPTGDPATRRSSTAGPATRWPRPHWHRSSACEPRCGSCRSSSCWWRGWASGGCCAF